MRLCVRNKFSFLLVELYLLVLVCGRSVTFTKKVVLLLVWVQQQTQRINRLSTVTRSLDEDPEEFTFLLHRFLFLQIFCCLLHLQLYLLPIKGAPSFLLSASINSSRRTDRIFIKSDVGEFRKICRNILILFEV
jgi:hypothetical protein